MQESLSGENEFSEDDEPPAHELSGEERDFMVQSHGEAHGHLVRLLEFGRVQEVVGLVYAFSKAFTTSEPAPPEESEDSDKSMSGGPSETQSEKYRRYQRYEQQCEIPDPDQWAVWRCGRGNETDDDESSHNEAVEF
eukprot:s3096_g6.t1